MTRTGEIDLKARHISALVAAAALALVVVGTAQPAIGRSARNHGGANQTLKPIAFRHFGPNVQRTTLTNDGTENGCDASSGPDRRLQGGDTSGDECDNGNENGCDTSSGPDRRLQGGDTSGDECDNGDEDGCDPSSVTDRRLQGGDTSGDECDNDDENGCDTSSVTDRRLQGEASDDDECNNDFGTIVIEKKTVGGVGSFDFSSSPVLPSPAVSSGAFSITTLAENVAVAQTFSNLAADSSFDVTESVPDGWELTGLSCTAGGTWNQTTAKVSITVPAGGTVTCTYTDTKKPGPPVEKGTIVIEKKTVGGVGSFDFSSSPVLPSPAVSSGAFSITTLAENVAVAKTFSNLAAGSSFDVTETVPDGWKLTGLSCTTGGTANQASAKVSITVPAGGTVTCTYTDTKNGNEGGGGGGGGDRTAPTPVLDLAISKSASPTSVNVGDTITWTITVTNIGATGATNVTVTDTLPSGVAFVSASTSAPGSCTGTTCNLGSLGSGASATITVVTTATAAGPLVNRASVSASESESSTKNNTAEAAAAAVAKPAVFKPPRACGSIKVGIKQLAVGQRTVLRIVVRDTRGKALKGAKVSVRGAGVAATGRTGRAGIARIVVTPKKTGVLRITAGSLRCSKRLGVLGEFQPPLTG